MADHHHKHESNVLVEKLGQAYQGVKQGPSRSTMLLAGLAVLAVVLVFTWRYFSTSSRETSSARWLRLDEIEFAPQLDSALNDKDFAKTPQGRLARFKKARVQLYDGLRGLGAKKEDAFKNVKDATNLYEELLKEPAPLPLLYQEALWGAAKGNESLGNLDRAKELYNKLASDKETKGSVLAKDAEKQLQRLDDKDYRAELMRVVETYRPPPEVSKAE
jgi:hypothetical protein